MTKKRTFFALWPSDDTRDKLVEVCRKLPPGTGRIVPRQNLHITLAFLGSLDDAVVADLRRGAAAIAAGAFSLRLDEIGWWRKPRVVWLGATTVADALLGLVADINTLITVQAIRPDSRPYQPHLTIARKAAKKPREIDFSPINWRIDSFCLVQSSTLPAGAVYEVVETWPLSSD